MARSSALLCSLCLVALVTSESPQECDVEELDKATAHGWQVIQRFRNATSDTYDGLRAELEKMAEESLSRIRRCWKEMGEQLEKMGEQAEKVQQKAEKAVLRAQDVLRLQERIDDITQKLLEGPPKKEEEEVSKKEEARRELEQLRQQCEDSRASTAEIFKRQEHVRVQTQLAEQAQISIPTMAVGKASVTLAEASKVATRTAELEEEIRTQTANPEVFLVSLQNWCASLNLPPAVLERLQSEDITSPGELAFLPEEDLGRLVQDIKMGPKARFLVAVRNLKAAGTGLDK